MINVADVAYGRLQVPDLDRMEAFLTEFGLVCTDRTPRVLYMRGTDPEPYLHVIELGEPKFLGIAFNAQNEGDLEQLATLDGASQVEGIDAPGGGHRVHISDPNGITIEVVHGITTLDPLPVRDNLMNSGANRFNRTGCRKSLQPGPAHVKRLGHVGIVAPNPRVTQAWYRDTLGLLGSDEVYVEHEGNIVASFNRVNQGQDFVDHHTLLVVAGPSAGLNHLAFEVPDIDDLLVGHDHLKRNYSDKHLWGPGRHVIGSQVFDYWLCPWAHLHEHWTDSDMLNDSYDCAVTPRGQGVVGSQWGPPPPKVFVDQVS